MPFRVAVAGEHLQGFSGIPRSLIAALGEQAEVREWPLPTYRPRVAKRVAMRLQRALAGTAYLWEKDPARCAFLGRAIDERASREPVDAILILGSEAAAFSSTAVPLFAFGDAIFGSRVDLYPDQMLDRLAKRSVREGVLVQQRALDRLRALFITSRWAFDRAVDRFHYRAVPGRIDVTLIGPNLPHVSTAPPLPAGALRLLWVGVDWHRKGGDLAVAAVRQLRRAGVDAHLDVVGVDVPASESWMRVHGRLGPSALCDAYSRASALLLPTAADLTPVVVAEAAMFARPVIASPAGGIPEMIRDAMEGVLVSSTDPAGWADSIRQSFEQGQLPALGQAARLRYEQVLNWRSIAVRMVERMRSDRDS